MRRVLEAIKRDLSEGAAKELAARLEPVLNEHVKRMREADAKIARLAQARARVRGAA